MTKILKTRIVAGAANGIANAATTNGNTHINVTDDNTFRSGVVIKGTGSTSVTSDASGNITVHSTDTDTWRPIQNNLTSTATDQSLSAAQGKALNDKFSSYVPTSRTVNGKALSSNITLSAGDVGAAASSHSHNYAGSSSAGGAATKANGIVVSDTRNDNSAPKDAAFDKQLLTADFKYSSKIGSPTGFSGTYCGVLSFAPWTETSGGHGYQLAFGYANEGHPRLALRGSDLSAASWNSWYKIYTSDDKPTLSELGAAAASHTHSKSQISDFPSKLEPYFANNTWYVVGDDAAIGDHNKGGAFCVKGLNGTPNISLYNSDDSYYGQCITTADIGSQSVSHANTAGSVAWTNVSGRPTIPSVGNGTITITQNGATKGTFTLNQSGNATIALTDNDTNTWRPEEVIISSTQPSASTCKLWIKV